MTCQAKDHRSIHMSPRVAFFNRRFHSLYGAQSNVIRLASLMEIDKRVIFTTAKGQFYDACCESGVDCHILKAPASFLQFGGAILKLSLLKKLLLIPELIAYNWKLLHSFNKSGAGILFLADAQCLPFAFLICILRQGKVIVYVQGDDTGPFLRLLAGLLVDRILLISHSLETSFIKSWPACRARIRVLHSGFLVPEERIFEQDYSSDHIRSRFIESHCFPSKVLLVGLVGSITHRKGGDILLRAAIQVIDRFPHVRFIFFGSVPPGHEHFLQELEELVQQNELTDFVVFAGHQPRDVIYLTSDVVVLPSRSEGLPSVLIEALSYGISVVATDIAGAKEIVRHPSYGQLVPPDSVAAIADALLVQLAEAEDTRERTGSPRDPARRQFIRENFSDSRYLADFLDCCNELCNDR